MKKIKNQRQSFLPKHLRNQLNLKNLCCHKCIKSENPAHGLMLQMLLKLLKCT